MPFRRGRPGVMGTVARTAVIAGTARATANAVDRRSQDRAAAAQQQEAVAAEPPPPPAPASTGTDDLVAKLTDLARLRDSGALTDAEFETAKGKILSA